MKKFNEIRTLSEGLNAFKELEEKNACYKAFDKLHYILEEKFNVDLNFYSNQRISWGNSIYCPNCDALLGEVKLVFNKIYITINGEEYMFEILEEELPLMECECGWIEESN